jgi:hypothetical protein
MRILSNLIIAGLLLLASCLKPEADPDSFPPIGRDEVALREVNVLNFTPSQVELELKMNMLYFYRIGCLDEEWGDFVLNYAEDLPLSAMEFLYDDFYEVTTTVTSATKESPANSGQAYSALLLVDNTLDFPLTDTDDPYSNRKFEAINYFFKNTPKPSNFALAAFAEDGKMGEDIKFLAGFDEDWQKYASEAIQLSEQEGGDNNLLDALDEAIGYVDQNATNPNKTIVVITHSYPDYSLSEYQTIVNKAISKQVSINIIDMSYFIAADINAYSMLTTQTGGFWVSASPTNQSSYPVFGYGVAMIQLHELLNRQFQEYVIRLRLDYTGNQANYFESGYIYPHIMTMRYYRTQEKQLCGTKYFLDEFETNYVPYAFSL